MYDSDESRLNKLLAAPFNKFGRSEGSFRVSLKLPTPPQCSRAAFG